MTYSTGSIFCPEASFVIKSAGLSSSAATELVIMTPSPYLHVSAPGT
jgi:hypothetical protein